MRKRLLSGWLKGFSELSLVYLMKKGKNPASSNAHKKIFRSIERRCRNLAGPQQGQGRDHGGFGTLSRSCQSFANGGKSVILNRPMPRHMGGSAPCVSLSSRSTETSPTAAHFKGSRKQVNLKSTLLEASLPKAPPTTPTSTSVWVRHTLLFSDVTASIRLRGPTGPHSQDPAEAMVTSPPC